MLTSSCSERGSGFLRKIRLDSVLFVPFQIHAAEMVVSTSGFAEGSTSWECGCIDCYQCRWPALLAVVYLDTEVLFFRSTLGTNITDH